MNKRDELMTIFDMHQIKVSEIKHLKKFIVRLLDRAESAVKQTGLDPDKVSLSIKLIPDSLPGRQDVFDKQIFMGSGLFSVLACNMLHGRLQDALSWLSGLQQLNGMGMESDPGEETQAIAEIKAAVDDIQRAILGNAAGSPITPIT